MKKSLKHIFALLMPVILVGIPAVANAQTFLRNPLTTEGGSLSAAELVGRIVQGFLSVAGVLAMAFIIYGGMEIVMGFKSGKETKINKGKQTVMYAILGLIVAFGGFIVVNEIIKRLSFLVGQ